MPGYGNRVITIPFPELAESTDDPIWVALRNPRMQPPSALRPREIPTDADGKPLNQDDAMEAMYEIIAGLVIGWRVYDATEVSIDQATGQPADQELLPHPATPALVKKLPMAISTRIMDEVKQAANPQ
jgi:hypothetical protein